MRLRRTLTVTTALLLAAPAGAVAQQTDLRSPDAIDAASQGGAPVVSPVGQDLRSPDAIDAATPREAIEPARVIDATPDGFDAGDAAVGAGITVGLVLLVTASGAVVVRRRAESRPLAS